MVPVTLEEKNYNCLKILGVVSERHFLLRSKSFVLHLYSTGLCSLGTVCCFLAGVDLLHQELPQPKGVEWSLGWSLYLALISFPLQMMAAALFLWAARSHSKNYMRVMAYRVA